MLSVPASRDALAADLRQYYGLDLDDELGRYRFGALRVLAEQLPVGSRTVARADPRAGWDEDTYLLALVADNLSFLRYERSGGKGHRPKPVQRPKAPRRHRHVEATDAQIRALLFDKR